jgi:hypothetical protein
MWWTVLGIRVLFRGNAEIGPLGNTVFLRLHEKRRVAAKARQVIFDE